LDTLEDSLEDNLEAILRTSWMLRDVLRGLSSRVPSGGGVCPPGCPTKMSSILSYHRGVSPECVLQGVLSGLSSWGSSLGSPLGFFLLGVFRSCPPGCHLLRSPVMSSRVCFGGVLQGCLPGRPSGRTPSPFYLFIENFIHTERTGIDT
jgi:hypothetical protein